MGCANRPGSANPQGTFWRGFQRELQPPMGSGWSPVSCFGRMVKVWDAPDRPGLFTLKGHIDEVLSVSYRPDNARIISRDVGGK